jgi:Tol biopolymer transport system component
MSTEGDPRLNLLRLPKVTEQPSIRLESWKEIASYLMRSERTVRRWEETEELPVHRQLHEKRGSVYAYVDELDAWRQSRRLPEPEHTDLPQQQSIDLLNGSTHGDAPKHQFVGFNEISSKPVRLRPRLIGALIWLFILLAVLGSLFAVRSIRQRTSRSVQALTAIPLTTDPGNEVQPTLSPDGNEVAFAYNDGTSSKYHIFEKTIGSEEPVRLTTDSTNDRNPSWSPDGQNIAFLRFDSGQNARVMTIPSAGGAAKEIATLQVDPTETEVSISWSPNGEWIATSEAETPHSPMSLVLISASTGEKRRVLYEPATVDADLSPSFSPDGGYIAFARHLGPYTADIYILEIPREGGMVSQARRLTNSTRMNTSPVWTRDGQSIIFIGDHSQLGRRIWRIPAFNHGDAVLLNEIGQDSSSIALSARANRLVYAKHMVDSNIWRINLDPVLSESGHRQEISKSRLIASTRQDFNPQYSPDGTQIAYQSDRSGDCEIWLADKDGTSPRQLTHLHAEISGFPRWSPDGKYIVFHSRLYGYANLFIVNVKTGDYRKLTAGLGNDTAPTWSHDGKWIYFGSEREAGTQIWRLPASGGSANRLTKTDGVAALESVDGKTLYFSKVSDPGLWSLPLAGGTESIVLPSLYGADTFAVAKRGIYFVRSAPESQAIISFKDFSSGAIEDLAVLKAPIGAGLAISPDEGSLLYTQLDRTDSDLFLVDNFR